MKNNGKSVNNDEKFFQNEILHSGYPSNAIATLVFVIYAVMFIQNKYVNFEWLWLVGCAFLVYLLVQFAIGPFTNANSAKKTSRMIYEWKKKGYSRERRTALLKSLLHVPMHVYLSVIVVFSCAFTLWIVLCWIISLTPLVSFSFTPFQIVFIVFSGVMSAYIAAIFDLINAEKVCSKYAQQLVSEGIDDYEINEKHLYGVSLQRRFRISFLYPILFSVAFDITAIFYEKNHLSEVKGILVICVVFLMNALITLATAYLYQKHEKIFLDTSIKSLKDNIQNNSFAYLPTELGDELSYITYLINKNGDLLFQVIKKASDLGEDINSSAADLIEISTESSTSAIQQSTSVREIVASMEYADSLSKDVATMIDNVNNVVNENFNSVEKGFEVLNGNLSKMVDISESNVGTIKGIKNLSEQINGIWDIVNIISNIAEQTKIIAFNAELEASSAGEYGKNFHIVANEIRRLADSVSESTNEIKESIYNIQHSSDELIISSKDGTFKINEGLKLSEDLNKNFEFIKGSSSSIQLSASEIRDAIIKQSSAFEQILETLRQISSSIEQNSQSSHTITEYVKQLKDAADGLKNIKKNSIDSANIIVQ